MSQLQLKIVTPEREIFNDSVDMVIAPSSEGEIGILPGHVNLMSKLVPGEMKIKKSGREHIMATGGGFLQVAGSIVTIMTDLALREEEIDLKVVEEAKKRAEQALEQKLSDEEYAETLAVIEKSIAQLKIKRRHRMV